MTKSLQTTATAPDPAAPEGPRFASLPLPEAVLGNLLRLGYLGMTPIQAASLPLALAGHDLIAQAKTGSGKTAAFALALLVKLDLVRFHVQALVLCPTRELADQVTQALRRLARADDHVKVLTLCGGATMRPQLQSLAHGAHVVVGTPGRIAAIARRDQDPPALLRAARRRAAARGVAAAQPLPTGRHAGVLQHQAAVPRLGRGVARARLRRTGTARRPRPARARPGHGALRQPQHLSTYVAVQADIAERVQRRLSEAKVKGRAVKVRLLPA